MHNLDNIVKIYYSTVSARSILEKRIRYDNFPRQEFERLCKAYVRQYSDTENRQLYQYVLGSAYEEGHPFARMENRSGLNVFAALEELAEQLLTMENNEVQCIYGNLLRFRQITNYIEEDLLVCAYLVMHYKKYGRIHTDFGWNTAIGHNNLQLRRIMEKGISENHFHLYGSAPLFHLLWIHFMNHVEDGMLSKLAERIEARQRVTREHYSVQYSEDPFETMILKAALIRAQIMLYLLKDEMDTHNNVWHYDIEAVLSGQLNIREYYCEIQRTIDSIRNYVFLLNYEELTDYAIYMVKGLKDATAEKYWFAGERWMMYQMLSRELAGEAKKDSIYYSWFYAYLVLKQAVRSELVQVNDTVGFENFSIYTERKKKILDRDKMTEAAIYGSMASGNIHSLEIRISPGENASDNARIIRHIDSVIEQRENPISRENYYYVFHFSKEKDEPLPERICFDSYACRHYRKRRKLETQARAVIAFRESYRKAAAELLGIDACSQEIGCRPEVFAPVFRLLSNHVVERVVGLEDINVAQLKKTFHVGEDFLDVVDGLRAVDEAVRFLDLKCGDRIGHGTVLGIDVRKWYRFKQNTILLSRQDYLDNVVWLYHKLAEYQIDGAEYLRAELMKEFELYFAEIYLQTEAGNRQKKLHANINTYYEAWKLRGDEPALYCSGYFDKGEMLDRTWFINENYPEQFRVREHEEIAYLYYLYHFDWDVRKNGETVTQIYLTPAQVEGVCALQKQMQKRFVAQGIGVETNPSSNFAISTMQGYEEHPVVVLYNKDITWDMDQIRDCPQVNVSINTDDKGIFHTSLENEYALMACAMEKVRDEKGNQMYNRQMVYQWIDNIREMGNMQSFREHFREQQVQQDEKEGGQEHGWSTGKNNLI